MFFLYLVTLMNLLILGGFITIMVGSSKNVYVDSTLPPSLSSLQLLSFSSPPHLSFISSPLLFPFLPHHLSSSFYCLLLFLLSLHLFFLFLSFFPFLSS